MSVERPPLSQLVEQLAGHVKARSNAPDLEQATAQLGAALALYEAVMPADAPSGGLHVLFGMLRDLEATRIEGCRGRLSQHDEAVRNCRIIAAVEHVAAGRTAPRDVAKAYAEIARLAGLEPVQVKRIRTRWAKRPSRSTGSSGGIGRGGLDVEARVQEAARMIREAERADCDMDVFLRDFLALS